jgi:hypothetical protein
VLTQLDAETLDEGVSLRWAFNERNVFTSFTLERSATESGPWTTVPAELREDQGVTVAVDRTTEAGATYFYRLIGTTQVGTQAVFGPVKGRAGAPREFALSSAWPNPSHGPVSLQFAMPRATHVKLSVVDLMGREMAVLVDGTHKAGRFQVDWDGRSDHGAVPAGLYFIRFVTPEKKLTTRVAITP